MTHTSIVPTFVGRDLHLTVGDLEPYVIHPLPGAAGMQMTETFVAASSLRASAGEMTDALAIAIDGAIHDPSSGTWLPHPIGSRINAERMSLELSLGETEDVAMTALFWQTVLNEEGVILYLGEGGGVGGHTKALRALALSLGLSLSTTSPRSALETLIPTPESSPSTSTLPAGAKPGRRPLDRLPKALVRKRKPRAR